MTSFEPTPLPQLTPSTLKELEVVSCMPGPYSWTSPALQEPEILAIRERSGAILRVARSASPLVDTERAKLLVDLIEGDHFEITNLAKICLSTGSLVTSCNSTYSHALLWNYGDEQVLAENLAGLCSAEDGSALLASI